MKWQPIENAPQDGTWILAICAGNHPELNIPYIPIVVKWNHDTWDDDIVDPYGNPNLNNWHPTHWMPLPEPPTVAQS